MTTFVQQIDAQGPVVVDRITTEFADVACSADNARKIVEALHSGTAVTLTANGQTASFTPSVNLGYGEAYIAMALAAEALRNAGVNGCATPDQWKAALMGGPLAASGTTTTSTSTSASSSASSNFPGVIALRNQGQGWGQIAQATNVQLGRVVSNARSSLSLGDELTPTGRTGAENRSYGTGSSSSTTGSSSDTNTTIGTSDSPTGTTGTTGTPSSTSSSVGTGTTRDSDSDRWSTDKKGKGKAKGHDNDKGRDRDRSEGQDEDSSGANRAQSSSSSSSSGSPSPNR